jgi:quinoprotein glucose dehydrogenase
MRKAWSALLVGVAVATVPVGRAQQARTSTAAGDWPTYNRDLAGTRFSPLAQITPENVSRLQPAWTFSLRPPNPPAGGGGPGGGASQAVPIVVNGVMYLPFQNKVVALEADTGKIIWEYQLAQGQASRRGLAFWPGEGSDPSRIMVTSGSRLLALNAATGDLSSGFGRDGIVETVVPYNSAPTIFKNVVMIGANVNEVPQGPPGDTRAYDAHTGKKLWDFHTVPQPGEFGNNTWGDGWKERSGTNIWGFSMTVDEPRGLVYMPIGGPAANYYGGDRPGDNLFGNSIVAVDVQTGKRMWHFQTVHHDLWDLDQPSAPGLVDIMQNGRTVPALAAISKTGYLFILDRTNGKAVFGVEERPVPKGDVPGEWYSPTQPFPVKPGPLSRISFDKERDMVTAADTSAEHVQACQEMWDKAGGYENKGPFTPFRYHEDGAPPKSTITFPGGTGGVNWGGTATDPRTGFIFMNSHDTSLVGWVEKRKPGVEYSFDTRGSNALYDRASVDGPGPFHTFSAPFKTADGRTVSLPCQRPPWAKLIAVNANTGEVAWQTTLGLTEALPEGKQNTGNSGSAGPTVTGGGLVFIGATNDRRFRAFDSKTGKQLWMARLDAPGNANPISYQGKNGKQYVAIVATDSVVVFGLP